MANASVYDNCKGQNPRLGRFENAYCDLGIGKWQESSCEVDVGPKSKYQTFDFGPVDPKPN
jgi:hypothetical protein